MMFIRVALEALVSPNDLMLNAPSSSESERLSRARSRPTANTECILSQAGCTVQKHRLLSFLKLRKKGFFSFNFFQTGCRFCQLILSRDSELCLSLTLLWDSTTDATPGAWNTWPVAFPVCEFFCFFFYLAASQQLHISCVQLFLHLPLI